MVAEIKALGATVELITNGTLLDEGMSRGLIDVGLDRLWVSLDGARPESYTDVRLGATLPQVIANLARFRDLRVPTHLPTPEIGIAFVAMRRNIADLPALLRLGRQLGAMHFLVTNILPYTREMQGEALYQNALTAMPYLSSPWAPHLDLPKIDINQLTGGPLFEVLRGEQTVALSGSEPGQRDQSLSVHPRRRRRGRLGWSFQPVSAPAAPNIPAIKDVANTLLQNPIRSATFITPRCPTCGKRPRISPFERVQAFDFSPCTFCGGCEFSETNEEDCYGNTFPTCGGCLWAQGIIRCP